MVQLPEVHAGTVRPTERFPRAPNPDAKGRGNRDNAVSLRHVEPARVPLRHAASSPPQTRSIGWRKNNRTHHSISYLDTLIKTGNESIEAIIRRRRILLAEFVARLENTRLPKCVVFGELVGMRKKSARGVSWTTTELSVSTPTSGRLQPRTRGNGTRWKNKGRNVSTACTNIVYART